MLPCYLRRLAQFTNLANLRKVTSSEKYQNPDIIVRKSIHIHISIQNSQKHMKALKTIFRLSTLLKPHLATVKAKVNPSALAIGGLASTYAFYLASQKILSEQVMTFQIDDNLQDGEMKEVQVGPKIEDTVLVMKYQGEYYCTQSKCSHFGFSLAKGLLVGDKILCPLHNAGFDVKTGMPEQGPVLDGLKTFPVTRSNGKVVISVPKTGWQNKPEKPVLGEENIDKSKKIVIIGAGPAAISATETLRETGYKGLIYMVSKEKDLPYDRTLLSKMMQTTKKPGPFRSAENLQKNGIVFVGESTVTGIDYKNKKVNIDSKQSLSYDKLLIASGCVNRFPPIKGLNETEFNSLRNIQDYEKINTAIRGQGVKNVTIIGAGFIGMEVASAIKLTLKQNVNVSVIDQASTPLERVVGKDVGEVLRTLAQKNGVKVITSANINSIKSHDGKPVSVELKDSSVPTDVLIMATGVRTALDFAQDLIDKDTNGIKTDAFLETSKKDVYAAGDVAAYPFWYTGRPIRIEHFNEAIYQGSVAALNMAGRKYPMDNVPFFWTRQFNNSLCVTGSIEGWDEVFITGKPEELKFTAYYIDKKHDKVLGTAVMGIPNVTQMINEAIRYGVMPKASQIKAGNVDLNEVLKEVKKKNPKCTRCGKTQ